MKIIAALFSLIFFGLIATGQNQTYHPVPKSITSDEIMNSKIDSLKLSKDFPTENTAQMEEDDLINEKVNYVFDISFLVDRFIDFDSRIAKIASSFRGFSCMTRM